jgi:hypothetical protein
VKPAEPKDILAALSHPLATILPEGSTTQAIAGYLFFRITESASFYELDYKGHGAWLTLPLKP